VSPSASSNSANGESVGIAAAGVTDTVDVAALFAGFVSVFDEDTVAVFDTGPGVDGRVTTSEIVAEPPLLIVPREHVTVVVPLQLPWLGVAETNVVPAGMTSVTVTPPAGAGPALLTPIEYVTGRPVPFGGGDALLVIDRSTEPPVTLVVTVPELFDGFPSGVPLLAVAVLEMVEPPAAATETASTMVNDAEAPALRIPTVHTTLPVPPTAGFVHEKAAPDV